MPEDSLATLAVHLSSLRRSFYRRGFENMLVVLVGWLLTADPVRYITSTLVATGVSAMRRWEPYHRFFSRGGWLVDRLSYAVWSLVFVLQGVWFSDSGGTRLVLIGDDSLCRKKSTDLYGSCFHVDAVSSSKKHKNFSPGHCWVTLAVALRVPWSQRVWAVPILFRLYRGKKCAGDEYQKKSFLLRQMVDTFVRWLPAETKVDLLLDSGYVCRTVLKDLASTITVIGAAKSNTRFNQSKVERAKKKRGRPRKKGQSLPTCAELVKQTDKLKTICVKGYIKARKEAVLPMIVQWYSVCKETPIKALLVPQEKVLRVYVCTEPTRSTTDILNRYCLRWALECWFRDAKQYFGWADSPARSKQAVLHMAPWVGLMSTVLVVWFHQHWNTQIVKLPCRPWYWRKTDVGLSFQDLQMAARTTVTGLDVLSWAQELAGTVSAKPNPQAPLAKCAIPKQKGNKGQVTRIARDTKMVA